MQQQLRKTPMAYHQITDQHIQTMVKQGLIEPCRGDRASNVVLVQKKDKTFHFCLDYRQLNLKSRKEEFPILRIDASLDALAGSSWLSNLDLRSGYCRWIRRMLIRPRSFPDLDVGNERFYPWVYATVRRPL